MDGNYRRKVRAVEQVKHFHTELEGDSFCQFSVLYYRQVNIRVPWIEVLPAAFGTVLALNRILESCGIKPLCYAVDDCVRNAGIWVDSGNDIARSENSPLPLVFVLANTV